MICIDLVDNDDDDEDDEEQAGKEGESRDATLHEEAIRRNSWFGWVAAAAGEKVGGNWNVM